MDEFPIYLFRCGKGFLIARVFGETEKMYRVNVLHRLGYTADRRGLVGKDLPQWRLADEPSCLKIIAAVEARVEALDKAAVEYGQRLTAINGAFEDEINKHLWRPF